MSLLQIWASNYQVFLTTGGSPIPPRLVHAAGHARGGRAHEAGERVALAGAAPPTAGGVLRGRPWWWRAALQLGWIRVCVSTVHILHFFLEGVAVAS